MSENKQNIQKEIEKYISKKEFEEKIKKIIQDTIKNDPMFDDKVLDINKNVLTQLYKNLWMKRNTWLTGLKNKNS